MKNFMGKGLTGSEIRRLKVQLKRTRMAMLAERIAHAFWPLFVVFCLIVAAILLGVFEAFGPLGHRIALGVSGLLIAAALVLGGMRYRKPTMEEIEDRLDAADRRRPLATLRDELAVGRGEKGTETVWAVYRQRARAAAAALMARAPDLRLSGRDRWGLRYFAPALLIGGLIATGGNVADPIAAVTDPAPVNGAADPAAKRAPTAEAWAIPPAYTGQPTIYLEKKADAVPVKIPAGSQITIRVTDFEGTPTLEGATLAGIEAFNVLGGGLAEASGLITKSGTLTVKAGEETLAAWTVDVIPDSPPEIRLTEPPSATVTRALSLSYEVTDDYGVTAAWAEIAPEGYSKEQAKGLPLDVISLGLPLPFTRDSKSAGDTSIHDFTSHPWAGADVVLKLYAEDGAGQQGKAEPLTFTLPERIFTVPLARALVEQRRDLALDYGQAERVLDVLQSVTRKPEEIINDAGVYLTLRVAIRRLAIAVGTETVAETAPNVIELLWQAALGLEDGNLSSALEKLRQAMEKLRQALENGSDEDVRRAMEEMRQAMNEYLQQLAQQQRQQNQQQGQQQQRQNGQQMTQQDLERMLEEMLRQSESGARDRAREMLSELQRMMENMRARNGQQQNGPGQQALRDLQDLIRKQRDLADETFDQMRQRRREQGRRDGQQGNQGQRPGQEPGFGDGQGRGNQHGQNGQRGQGQRGEGGEPGEGGETGENTGRPGAGGGLAQDQEALRRRLEELTRGIGSDEAARALEEAVRSMDDARKDLEGNRNSDAIRDQMRALDELNKGAEALAQEIQRGQGDTAARGNQRGRGQSRDSETEDPFDRPTASFGAMDGRATKVPDKALVDRARELMEELRRRSAEPQRPQLELDYLDRLMERF